MVLNNSISFCEITQKISDARVYLMGIAMFMVILFHCNCWPFSFFGYWGTDIFILLSGFGICFSLQKTKSVSSFYWRRFIRIAPAAVLCGTFFYLLLPPHRQAALAPFSLNLWYIRTILIFYAISPFLYYVIRRWEYKACALLIVSSELAAYATPSVCAHLLQHNNPFIVATLSWSLAHLPLFVVGMALPNIAKQSNLRIPMWVLFCFALIGLILLSMFRECQMVYNLNYVRYLFMPGSILLIPTIIYGAICVDGCLRHCPRLLLQILHFLGLFSLEIYLIHETVLRVVPHIESFVLSPALAKAICIVISLLLAWLVNRLCRILQTWALPSRH